MIKDKLETATERCLEKIYQPASYAARHGLAHKSLFFVSLLFVFFVFSIGHRYCLAFEFKTTWGRNVFFAIAVIDCRGMCVFSVCIMFYQVMNFV